MQRPQQTQQQQQQQDDDNDDEPLLFMPMCFSFQNMVKMWENYIAAAAAATTEAKGVFNTLQQQQQQQRPPMLMFDLKKLVDRLQEKESNVDFRNFVVLIPSVA
mmetsp:Transcript_3384/g.4964  ORF Transcript_3384/g.4964 Transcript_3384/m.4964 type:complete len:104 (-) Transcript_3384:192-503(-)